MDGAQKNWARFVNFTGGASTSPLRPPHPAPLKSFISSNFLKPKPTPASAFIGMFALMDAEALAGVVMLAGVSAFSNYLLWESFTFLFEIIFKRDISVNLYRDVRTASLSVLHL